MDSVTVVVVTFAGVRLLPACLAALATQTCAHRLIVVDNGSRDGTSALLADRLDPSQVLRLPQNTGFAGGVAAALPGVSTRFVALLNDDAVPEPDWLAELIRVAVEDDRCAAWTSLMLLASAPGRVNNAGTDLLRNGYGADAMAGRDATDVTGDVEVFGFCGGACLLRLDAVRAVGGFPAEFFLYYEDLDTSWRLRSAGWSIRRVPSSRVVHLHSATSDQRSAMFHFYNERNRLQTLARNAPTGVVAREVFRFVLTSGSLALKGVHHAETVPANFRPGLRARVLWAFLTATPLWLRARRRSSRRAVLSRPEVWRRWHGRADQETPRPAPPWRGERRPGAGVR